MNGFTNAPFHTHPYMLQTYTLLTTHTHTHTHTHTQTHTQAPRPSLDVTEMVAEADAVQK